VTDVTQQTVELPIVERLRAKKTLDIGSAPHLDGSKEAPELVEWLVNPDGPEAAALIKDAVEALTEARKAIASLEQGGIGYGVAGYDHLGAPIPYPLRDELLATLDTTLTKLTGEKQ
jgi:hypothetical protein